MPGPAPSTSSLKQQLQQIQHEAKVITNHDLARHKSSYIAQPDLDRDTLHALASDALRSLIAKDDRFQPYQFTLFSDAVKTLDRKLLTRQENELLNSSISGLLRLLSKHFLTEPAALVLEWLVRRFNIQMYNVNHVFEAITPYHSTPQFLRMLLILDLYGDDTWAFMRRAQKARIAPDRTFFVQECLKRPALLQFYMEMTTKSIESGIENVALWSFSAAVLMEYLSASLDITDNVIRHVSPVLLEFLRAKRYPDVQMVACMSFALMLRRVPVTENVAIAFLAAMASALPSQGVDFEILTAIIAVCQTLVNVMLPQEAMLRAVQVNSVMDSLSRVCERYEANALLLPLTSLLVEKRMERPLIALLKSGSLSPSVVENIVTELSKLPSQDHEVAILMQNAFHAASIKHLSVLMNIMDKRQFKKELVAMYRIAVNATIPEGGQLHIPDVVKLNHSDKHMRIEALKTLDVTSYTSVELTEAIIPRLYPREDQDVLETALTLKCLDQIDEKKLAESLAKIVDQSTNKRVVNAALKVVVSRQTFLEYPAIVETLASVMLVTRSRKLLSSKLWEMMSTSSEKIWLTKDAAMTIHESLVNANKAFKENKDRNALNEKLDALLKRIVELLAAAWNSQLLANLMKSKSVRAKVLAMLVLVKKSYHAIGDNQMHLMTILVKLLPTPTAEAAAAVEGLPPSEVVKTILAHTSEKESRVESAVASMAYASLLSLLPMPLESVSWLANNPDDKAYCDFVRGLYRVAAAPTASPSALKGLLETHISHNDGTLPFVFAFFLRESLCSITSPVDLAKALDIATLHIRTRTEKQPLDYQMLLPSLLVALRHPSTCVTSAAKQVAMEVRQSYKALDLNATTEQSNIACVKTFFGSTSNQLLFLETRQAAKLVERLSRFLSAWVADLDALDAQFGDVLLDAADGIRDARDRLITFFLTHCLAFPDNTARCSLLALFESVDTPAKLQTLFPLVSSTLDSRAVPLARAVLRCYTPTTISSLSSSKSKRYIARFCMLLDHSDTQSLALDTCRTPSWFTSLRDVSLQQQVFRKLVDIAISVPTQGAASVRLALGSLPVSVSMVNEEIQAAIGMLAEGRNEQVSKKSRIDECTEESKLVHRLAILLEMLPQWSDLAPALMEALFDALALTVDRAEDPHLSAEYLRQLILNGILLGVQRTTRLGNLRIDLVVQSMRVTDNPQVHQTCLLILAALAKNTPENILHNIMSVFTFMTNNLLRVDDSYSFFVADQLVKAVAPSLMQHSTPEALNDIIELFVNAVPHIPAHRRVPLFVVLLSTIGAAEYFSLVISSTLKSQQFSAKLNLSSDVLQIFCIELSREFDVLVVLKTSILLLETADGHKEDALQYVSNVFSDKAFADKIPSAFASSSIHYADIQQQYLALFNLLLSQCSEYATSSLAVLSRVVPLASYIQMASALLPTVSKKIKLRVVSSLHEALVDRPDEELKESAVSVNEMIGALENTVLAKHKITKALSTTLETLATAATKLAKLFPDVYASLLCSIVNTYLVRWSTDTAVLAVAFRLLAALCRELGPRAIPSLPKLLPQALELSASVDSSDTSVVHESVVILVDTVIRQLPKFVGPSVPSILDYLALKHSAAVYRTLGKSIEPIVLLKVVTSRTVANATDAFVAVHIMDEIISRLSLEDLTSQSQTILQIYLRVFNVTDPLQSQKPIDSAIRFVLRLNETLFKPLFLRFRYWALSSNTAVARKSVFWKLVASLLDKLQAIFAPYVVQILDEIKASFEAVNRTKEFDGLWVDLWVVVRKFLLHYSDGVLASHVSSLVPLMVDQISFSQNQDYLAKMIEYVVPTVARLAVSLKDQPLLRTLHQQVLGKSRMDDPKVRLVAVCCLNEMWIQAGESLHVHLPETAPFLAELVEDDDERVERATKQWMQQLQTSLGPDERIEDLITAD
ncbi:hypothetical protein SeMB42_g03998 [Synchytrium endobioticum]|uniref:U3 small nucleolar RNA-associated protein 10 n=1 Tax=Synchytrium endobioticum TaxID=286115 RepID=A0A507D2B2_9FUNG|nr:hypothetical protein SeMB42_g03998 [Synchytrium endobioticum]TPX50067.1 hypothetical protein SeLEV6574_g01114 [Synchytrium endobioticum]